MIEIIIMVAGAAILGFLVGWLIRKLQKDRAEADLRFLQDKHQALLHKADDSIKDHFDLQRQVDDLRARKDAILTEVETTKKENKILEEKIEQLQNQPAGGNNEEVAELQREVERLKAVSQDGNPEEVQSLRKQITGLEAERETLKQEISELSTSAKSEDEIAPLKDLIDALENEKRDLLEKIESKSSDTEKLEEIERLKGSIAMANEEKEQWRAKLQSLTESLPDPGELDRMQNHLDRFESENSSLKDKLSSIMSDEESKAKISELTEKLNGLMRQNRELQEEKSELEEKLDEPVESTVDPKEIADLKLTIKALESEKESLQAALKRRMNETVAPQQISELEKKVEALERDIEPVIRSESDSAVNGTNGHEATPQEKVEQPEAEESIAQQEEAEITASTEGTKSESVEERLDTTLTYEDYQARKKALLSNVGKASESEKDDLSQIVGVGPFIEAKLNSIGIYTYEQISKFSDDDIEHVTRLIEFFPGRIERDGWVRQANKLLKKKEEV